MSAAGGRAGRQAAWEHDALQAHQCTGISVLERYAMQAGQGPMRACCQGPVFATCPCTHTHHRRFQLSN
jgi:hypothetical protein